MATNTPFTIYNVSTASVTYQGQTILAGGNYVPTTLEQADFASDPGLVADTLAGKVSIGIGANSWSNTSGVEVLNAAALPTAATSANQVTQITSLQLLDDAVGPVFPGTRGTKSILVGAVYNASAPVPTDGQQHSLQADDSGRLKVAASIVESLRASYSACANGITVAATPTDVFTIQGSATKTIKVTRIEVTGTTTAGSGISITCSLNRRSTANTGGTSTIETNTKYNTTNAAGTAVVRSYTANPSALGTLVGPIRTARMTMVNASVAQNYLVWDFGVRPTQSITLSGTSEFLCVNFGGTSITGNIISINVEWTEE